MTRAADHLEALAAAVVGRVLDAGVRYVDDGRANSTVDFVVSTASGLRIALEVSRSLEREYLRVAGAFAEPVAAPGLRHSWHLVLRRGAPIRRIKLEVEELLIDFEAEGGVVFSASVPPAEADPAVTDELRSCMRSLKIDVAYLKIVSAPSAITAQWGELTSGPRPSVAGNRAVEQVARSNAEKLRLAEADERHLFVWIGPLAPYGADLGFVPESDWGTVDEPPQLPAGIDVVWAALGPEVPRTDKGTPIFPVARQAPDAVGSVSGVWRVRPPSRWELLGDVPLG